MVFDDIDKLKDHLLSIIGVKKIDFGLPKRFVHKNDSFYINNVKVNNVSFYINLNASLRNNINDVLTNPDDYIPQKKVLTVEEMKDCDFKKEFLELSKLIHERIEYKSFDEALYVAEISTQFREDEIEVAYADKELIINLGLEFERRISLDCDEAKIKPLNNGILEVKLKSNKPINILVSE